MSAGGAGGPARPDGTQGPREPDLPPTAGEASAPWERPRRWARDRADATSVDDLMARLASSAPEPGSRRQRRDSDNADDAVPAGELIAALSAGAEPAPDAGQVEPTPDQQPGPAPEMADEPAPAGATVDEQPERAPGLAGDPDATTVLPAVPGPAEGAVPGPAEGAVPGPAEQRRGESDEHRADSSWESVLASLRRQAGTAEPAGVAEPFGIAAGGGSMRTPPPGAAGLPPAHADRPHRGWLIAGRSVVAVVAALLLVAAGTDWVIKARAAATLAGRSVSAIVSNDTNISTPTADPSHQAPEAVAGASGAKHTAAPPAYRAENILLMGSDTRDTSEDAELGGAGTTTMQSDVMMIAHLSADRSHVTVVSIPRDLYVPAPTCKAWNYATNSLSGKDYVSQYHQWKITNAYSAGGPQCTVRAVQKLTGLRINRVIIIDFAGFKSMVDALGGITITACRPIIDGNLGTVIANPGTQHINGTQALKLVRAREVYGDHASDLARIHRQQMVLSILLRQATSAGVLLNPAKLNSLLEAFVHNVRTDNVTLDDLLTIAQSLGDLNPSRVTFYTLPTVADGDGLRMTPVGPVIWNDLVNDKPLPGENATTPSGSTSASTSAPATQQNGGSSSAPSPSPITSVITRLVTSTPQVPQEVSVAPGDVDLQVVNVAGRGGVATMAMNALDPLGFHIGDPDLLLIPNDVRPGVTVEYSSGNRAAAVTVAAAVPGATLVPTEGLGAQVRLMLGSSFDGTVRPVSVGSPVPAALSTTPSPVVSTVVTTRIETPAASSGSASTSTRRTTSLSGVESVNAAHSDCF